jgi:SAM-dependent methyltransferase
MRVQSIVTNDLVQEASSVWVMKGHENFGYSDGEEAERYLENAFQKSRDLGTQSSELESYIKDWPSEYHLTAKRAQLLAGFSFDRKKRVLEVGCGCGAITRYLGETFDEVVSVEGSITRARLARLRTRDLQGVSILCAPFQDLKFSEKFDIVFCIGVYEYSGSFVNGPDPYREVLRCFSELLTPSGQLILAIENQFGLKYFNAAREDHIGHRYAGLEGYPSSGANESVRTFGRAELDRQLKVFFPVTRFFYPYPDYKLPDCVIAEKLLEGDRAAELVSQIQSRDYGGSRSRLWDESLVCLELARNGLLPTFANSFLVQAEMSGVSAAGFDQMAVGYSSPRLSRFRTVTRVVGDAQGEMTAIKRRRSLGEPAQNGKLTMVESESRWLGSHSLQTILLRRYRSRTKSLAEIFQPAKGWVEFLARRARSDDGTMLLAGDCLDAVWSNVYPVDDSWEEIDREWIWSDPIPLNVLVIRAIYLFLSKVEASGRVAGVLNDNRGSRLIAEIASTFGVALSKDDFRAFIELESEFQSLVFGLDRARFSWILRLYLMDRATLWRLQAAKQLVRRAYRRLTSGR